MHRIDTEGVVANGNGDGRAGFRDRDVLAGTPGTHVDADWLNSVQENLCRVVEQAGMTLEKSNHEQLHQAIRLLFLSAAGKVKTVTGNASLLLADDLATVRFDGAATATLTLPALTIAHRDWSVTISNESASPYVGLWVAPLVRVGLCPSETLVLRWDGAAWLVVRRTRTAQPGQTCFWESPVAPFGWSVRDATPIAVADYPALLAALYCGDAGNASAATGYRYNNPADPAGSRSTTGPYLCLADMRGEFERGWDAGRNVDIDRGFGTGQLGDIQSHSHGVNDPGHDHGLNTKRDIPGVLSGGDDAVGWPNDGGGAAVDMNDQAGISIQATGGEETRPRNVANLPIRRMI